MPTHDVENLLISAMFNTEPAVEPECLGSLIPRTHQYLGDLPHELCHMFVSVYQMNKRQFAFVQGDGQDANEAWNIFQKEVTHFFNLSEGTQFEVVSGFKVALVTSQRTPEQAHVSTVLTQSILCCGDFASY